MSKIDRRHFIQATVAGASAVSAMGCEGQTVLDRTQVVSVTEALLPDEIGLEGASSTADDFIAWIDGYAAGVERNHAYGSGDLSFIGELPLRNWIEQVRQLDMAAGERFSRSLTEINKVEKRALLQDVLAEFPEAQLGNPARAEHVAVAILSFFYRTPAATDLAYRSAIKKQQCRPLGDSPNTPISLG